MTELEFISEFNSKITNKTIISKKYGTGVVTEILGLYKTHGQLTDILIEVKFNDALAKGFALKQFLQFNPNEELSTIVDNYKEQFDELAVQYKAQVEREQEEHKKEIEAIKEKLAHELAQERLENRQQKQKTNNIVLSKNLPLQTLKLNDTLHKEIEYILEHATQIIAVVPDYLKSWFIEEFGTDYTPVVKDSSTSAAALSFKIKLDSNIDIPKSLMPKLQGNSEIKPINDIYYIYNLCKNYGFKFGKTQDKAAINAIIEK